MVKRLLSYFFTLVLVTFIAAVAVACVYFVIDGASVKTGTEKTSGQIVASKNAVIIYDKERGLLKDTYRVSTVQEITVKYLYHGKDLRVTKEITYDVQEFDFEPNLKNFTAKNKYKDGDLLDILVYEDNPKIFDIENKILDDGIDGLKTVLKYAVPIYVVVILLFIISFIRKERALKKSKFYSNYMRQNF